MTECKGCGAPVSCRKCEYCGREVYSTLFNVLNPCRQNAIDLQMIEAQKMQQMAMQKCGATHINYGIVGNIFGGGIW